MWTRICVIVLFCLISSSQAIVIRHDREDMRYRKLAASYPQVCRIGLGMGTLIDSLWVLTAGHVANGQPRDMISARFGDIEVEVTAIEVHPDFGVKGKHRDIGLLRLASPVTDISPAHLYRDTDELDQQIVFVGDGQHGTGLTGPSRGERIRRGAENRVDSVYDGWLMFTFDHPPAGEELEGISGPGDSGGPALIRKGDSLFVLGVSAYNDGDPECFYGSHEYYCRVSDELPWIEATMQGSEDLSE